MTDSTRQPATPNTRRPGPRRRVAVPPCVRWCDLRDGCLNSEQRVSWTGPPPPRSVLAALPETMDRLHFAAVERSAAGLIRCEVLPGAVDCRFLARAAALRFAEPETDASEHRVVRRWRISGGGLARPAAALGTIVFGWEAEPGEDGRAAQSLWARVEGYPSRFLPGAGRRGPWPPAPVPTLYAWYHAVVTCRYLRRMAAWMMERSEEAGAGEKPDAG